jgi:hypothetical protein
MREATRSQRWRLWKDTGERLYLSEMDLSLEDAKILISRKVSGEYTRDQLYDKLVELGAPPASVKPEKRTKAKSPKKDWAAIWKLADAAGTAAGDASETSPFGCGFAWIKFSGNSSFGRWAAKNMDLMDGYPTGKQIWVSQYGQSVDRKLKYATAASDVLREHGVDCYPGSRLD